MFVAVFIIAMIAMTTMVIPATMVGMSATIFIDVHN